jgi:hypothetical protein
VTDPAGASIPSKFTRTPGDLLYNELFVRIPAKDVVAGQYVIDVLSLGQTLGVALNFIRVGGSCWGEGGGAGMGKAVGGSSCDRGRARGAAVGVGIKRSRGESAGVGEDVRAGSWTG